MNIGQHSVFTPSCHDDMVVRGNRGQESDLVTQLVHKSAPEVDSVEIVVLCDVCFLQVGAYNL